MALNAETKLLILQFENIKHLKPFTWILENVERLKINKIKN